MAIRNRWNNSDSIDVLTARQLALARAGSAEALGTLLQGCRRYLLWAANQALESTLRPKEGASDLVQETFVIAQRDFHAFQGATIGELLAWLHRILERRLIAKVRHYKRTIKRSIDREVSLNAQAQPEAIGLVDRCATPAEEAATADEARQVQLAMTLLPEDYQRVLDLRTWQRLPFAEIGARMGRSPAAAEKLWLRAVERLQVELKALK